jgi:hypothetical protein
MTQASIQGTVRDTFLIGTVPEDKDRKQCNQKVALVYADHITNHKIIENIAMNRGYNVRVFTHQSNALDWLVG